VYLFILSGYSRVSKLTKKHRVVSVSIWAIFGSL
jgi:hypothetical protein